MKWVLILTMQVWVCHAEIDLLVVGDGQHPVQFVVLPFTYEGSELSPAVTIESHITQALSSTGLFSMPFRYDAPVEADNMLAWQMAGIRYVIAGDLYEQGESLVLRLTIHDTLGLQPTLSSVLLNPRQLELSSQMFADQVYRSLFYATFTNDTDKQYLNNENATLTRYLNQLVMVFKGAWLDNQVPGTCTVDIQQMPGGVPFKSHLQVDCFEQPALANEVKAALERVEVLPYEQYQDVFVKDLVLHFISTR